MLRLLVGPSGKITLLFNFFEVNRLVIASPYLVLAESSFITFEKKNSIIGAHLTRRRRFFEVNLLRLLEDRSKRKIQMGYLKGWESFSIGNVSCNLNNFNFSNFCNHL